MVTDKDLKGLKELYQNNFKKGCTIMREDIIDLIVEKQKRNIRFAMDVRTGEAVYIALAMGYNVEDYTMDKISYSKNSYMEKIYFKELREKHTIKEMCVITGESERELANKLRRYGIKFKKDMNVILPKEELEKDYFKMPMKKITKKYGVSESTIYKYLRKYGIKSKKSLTNHRQRCIM